MIVSEVHSQVMHTHLLSSLCFIDLVMRTIVFDVQEMERIGEHQPYTGGVQKVRSSEVKCKLCESFTCMFKQQALDAIGGRHRG